MWLYSIQKRSVCGVDQFDTTVSSFNPLSTGFQEWWTKFVRCNMLQSLCIVHPQNLYLQSNPWHSTELSKRYPIAFKFMSSYINSKKNVFIHKQQEEECWPENFYASIQLPKHPPQDSHPFKVMCLWNCSNFIKTKGPASVLQVNVNFHCELWEPKGHLSDDCKPVNTS